MAVLGLSNPRGNWFPYKTANQERGGGNGERCQKNAKKSRDQRAKDFYRSKSKNSHDENAN